MKKVLSVSSFFILYFSFIIPLHAQTAVGHWRDCLDYSRVSHVAHAGDRIYAAARGGVFYYDFEDNTLMRLCKGKGLSDVGVATMDYDPVTKCLVVAYNNSNVDILVDDHTYNISDIKRSEISRDKNIYHVRFANRRAYLTTGFGVVVLNLDRQEIKETWYLTSLSSPTASMPPRARVSNVSPAASSIPLSATAGPSTTVSTVSTSSSWPRREAIFWRLPQPTNPTAT